MKESRPALYKLTDTEQALVDLWREEGHRYANMCTFSVALGYPYPAFHTAIVKSRELGRLQFLLRDEGNRGKQISHKRAKGHPTMKP